MPKTDRILANLPPTFRVQEEPSALRALVDAFGAELQQAENTLAAVMRAHWVDHADAGEQVVGDLRGIGALYGLAPRDDETVEEFREHLKRYVRTFLDGTVTVRGILRIAAEALHLHIEDDDLDSWWAREEAVLVTETGRGADVSVQVLGVSEAVRTGHGPLPAVIEGDVDLGGGVDLRGRGVLRIALDGGGPVTVDLTAAAEEPAAVRPDEIVATVNETLGLEGFATAEAGRLRLSSPTTGPEAEIRVLDSDEDAAAAVLGLPARAFDGADARRATITGTRDLSNPVDLSLYRFLRVSIDGEHLAEIDCAATASDPASVGLGDVEAAVNDAFGFVVATHDGRFLTLSSPRTGSSSSVALLEPAAQSATPVVVGDVAPFAFGEDQRHARVLGQDIGFEVDLSAESRLRLAVDTEPAETVDISGAEPARTTPAEITAAINEGLQMTVASHDGRRLTLASPTSGSDSRLVVEEVTADAAEPVLGLRSRVARGRLPSTASLTGAVDLSGGVDLSARCLLVLSVDGAGPVEVDLRHGVDDLRSASLDELVDAVNHRLGREVARSDGAHLILVSPTAGAGGSLEVSPLRATRRRRFVTRARVSDDAATTLFGFTARRGTGEAASAARVSGDSDLVAGVDLRDREWLRLRVDDVVREVRVAGPRPRATTPAEITGAINDAFARTVAFTDAHAVTLVSPTRGSDSRIEVSPPHSRDALDALGLPAGLTRGRAATGVRFTGTADLAAGVELASDATLRLGVDGAPPIDIRVGDGTSQAVRTLSQITAAVNQALVGPVAAHDGTHLLLTSSQTGPGSQLDIQVPATGTDATASVLGIEAPRGYRGGAATAATVVGESVAGLPPELTANLLMLSVDGGTPVTVDITARADDPAAVTVADVAVAVNAATDAQAAVVSTPTGSALSIRSPSTGLSSRLELMRTGAADAAPLVLGRSDIEATGSPPLPGVLEGEVDLRAPVDLSTDSVLELAVDGAPAFDVDVAGVRPATTLLSEVVTAINAVRPGIAATTDDNRLRITSPTVGAESVVEVRPQRHLEVQEYPPRPVDRTVDVRHGDTIALRNTGAAEVTATVDVTTAVGVSGVRVADVTAGWSVRVLQPLSSHQRLTLDGTPSGDVVARVHAGDSGPGAAVPAEKLLVERTAGAHPLQLRRGRNLWSYGECIAARYDQAGLDESEFAGGSCREQGIFDVSRFDAPSATPAVYVGSGSDRPSTATLSVAWETHLPGAFVVNLPDQLDPRFGVRFGEGRFGTGDPESHPGVVTEPSGSADFIEQRINLSSRLVEAERVAAVPIGWSAVTLPFRDPVALSLGRRDQEARLYLAEEGLGGDFIEIRAAEPGEWGNGIALTGRASGPAIYDIDVHFSGARFENARRAVEGDPPPALADDLVEPGAVGVLTAKAAGVSAAVTRDRVVTHDPTQDQAGEDPAEEGQP